MVWVCCFCEYFCELFVNFCISVFLKGREGVVSGEVADPCVGNVDSGSDFCAAFIGDEPLHVCADALFVDGVRVALCAGGFEFSV